MHTKLGEFRIATNFDIVVESHGCSCMKKATRAKPKSRIIHTETQERARTYSAGCISSWSTVYNCIVCSSLRGAHAKVFTERMGEMQGLCSCFSSLQQRVGNSLYKNASHTVHAHAVGRRRCSWENVTLFLCLSRMCSARTRAHDGPPPLAIWVTEWEREIEGQTEIAISHVDTHKLID